MSTTHRVLGALAVAALVGACDNAGAYRTTGITATGIARGLVYFDANGSGTFDAGDGPVVGARLSLVTPVGRDTVVRAVTGADGTFRVEAVPVGSYSVIVDNRSVGDSADVRRVTPESLTLRPDDSLTVEALVGFPTITTSQVRALAAINGRAAVGSRVFVTGVALHARGTYSDTLLHVVDTTGALRATRVRPSAVAAGDSVRLRGRIAVRNGQRVLDDITVFIIGQSFIPTAPLVTTQRAAEADGGTLDAALVRILDAVVSDTATVLGNLTITVSDGSGDLTVLLDRVSDVAFRTPFAVGSLAPGARFDLVGVLVPAGGGAWLLRPRSVLDLTPR